MKETEIKDVLFDSDEDISKDIYGEHKEIVYLENGKKILDKREIINFSTADFIRLLPACFFRNRRF